MIKLSVIIPAYNEEKTLYRNVHEYNNYLKRQGYSYEILLVNDGSKDKTAEVAKKLKHEISELVFVNLSKNKGKGSAIREGMTRAKGEYRLFIDADNATSIDHLGLVWDKIKSGGQVIIGTRNPRDIDSARQVLPQAVWKRFLGTGGNFLIQLFLVPGVWDTQCGFKVFDRQSAEIIFPKTKIDRWALDVEILSLARKKKLKIEKIPVQWKNSDVSRVGLGGYFITLKEVFKIKKDLLLGKYN